jgi:hypothetical protein
MNAGEEAEDQKNAADQFEDTRNADHAERIERSHRHGRRREAKNFGRAVFEEKQAGHDAKNAEKAGCPGGDHRKGLHRSRR